MHIIVMLKQGLRTSSCDIQKYCYAPLVKNLQLSPIFFPDRPDKSLSIKFVLLCRKKKGFSCSNFFRALLILAKISSLLAHLVDTRTFDFRRSIWKASLSPPKRSILSVYSASDIHIFGLSWVAWKALVSLLIADLMTKLAIMVNDRHPYRYSFRQAKLR